MVYRIEPDKDRQYIEEFRLKPIGAHSPGLQRLLAVMRNDPSGWQVILVCRKPFAEWVLGRMPPKRIRSDRDRGRTVLHQPRGGGVGGVLPPLALADRREHQPAFPRLIEEQPERAMLKITGYPDRYSVAPGEDDRLQDLARGRRSFRRAPGARGARRLQSARSRTQVPARPDARRRPPSRRAAAHRCRLLHDRRRDAALAAGAFTFFAMIWPTLPRAPTRRLLAQWDPDGGGGFRIGITNGGELACHGRRTATATTTTVTGGKTMLERQWYAIAVAVDPVHRRVHARASDPCRPTRMSTMPPRSKRRLEVAPPAVACAALCRRLPRADGTIGRHFDGKIDGPMLLSGIHPRDRHDAMPVAAAGGRPRAADHREVGFLHARCARSEPSISVRPAAMGASSICRRAA